MKILQSKIAVVGDLHCGKKNASQKWHEQSLVYAQWLKDQLTKNKIKDIVFLGDILDNRNEVHVTTLNCLTKFFEILEEFNIVLLIGNHDSYYSKRPDIHSLSLLHKWENIHVVSKPELFQNEWGRFTFCPWGTSKEEIEKSDIVFGHFEINSFKQNHMHVCESGIYSQDLLSKSDLVLSGHFHLMEVRDYPDNKKIVYTGSTYEMNFGEAYSPKGFFLLDLDTKNLKFIQNTISPKHKKVKLSEMLINENSNDFILNRIDESNLPSIVKGNVIDFIIDKEVSPEEVSIITHKLNMFEPFDLKIEYLYSKELLLEKEFDTCNVNILETMIDFVKNIKNCDNKEALTDYLKDVYARANLTLDNVLGE